MVRSGRAGCGVVELGYVRLGQVRWGYYDAVIFLVRSGGVRLDTVGHGGARFGWAG